MQKSETAALLAMISAFDGRTPSQAAVEAWHVALTLRLGESVRFEDAKLAVTAHFANSGTWINPSDIGDFVERLRRTRRRCIAVQPPEEGLLDEHGNPVSQDAFVRIQQHRHSMRVRVENGHYLPDPHWLVILEAMKLADSGLNDSATQVWQGIATVHEVEQ